MKTKFGSLLFLLFCACGTRQEQTSQSTLDSLRAADSLRRQDSIRRASIPVVPPRQDKALDALGLFMAGLDQTDSNTYAGLQQERSWKEYKASTDSNWSHVYKERLGKMATWQKENLAARLNDTLSVFYPFSGPDFLHAFYLYPASNEFILVALEPIDAALKLDSLPAATRVTFLDSLGHSLRDSFRKSFFETNNMREDFKRVKGVLPLLYFFIERTGHELIGQEFLHLDADGNEVPTGIARLYKYKTPAVRLDFRDRTTKQEKRLYYFNINMLNTELAKRHDFEKFLKQREPFNTFVKSASYLMHRDTFSEIKRLITENSTTLFQDDTGIPYREFKDKLEWNIQFYGEYIKPVKLFEVRYQPDLDSAFKASASKVPLPFSLGYHWGANKHNYMLAKKSTLSTNK